eukprot:15144318-Heterocapsa_arctica.AAC.1
MLHHHVWDGAVKSACERASRRLHAAHHLHTSTNEDAADAILLELRSWGNDDETGRPQAYGGSWQEPGIWSPLDLAPGCWAGGVGQAAGAWFPLGLASSAGVCEAEGERGVQGG